MIKNKPANYKWSKEKCQEEALKYNHKIDFKKNSKGAYPSALKNGWLNEICSHMIEIRKPKGYWTLEKCKEESLKYNTQMELKNNISRAYVILCKNNIKKNNL
jgi:hypothetical protein